MQSLAVSGYTAAAVIAQLHSSNRVLAFRYDLLTSANQFKKSLTNVLGASVSNNALADIKRTARFTLKEDSDINFLSDRIKPWVRLKMPDGGYAEWPQGVFLLTTPPKKTDVTGIITREVDAYDQLQILADDKIADRYTVTAGTNYITAVKTVIEGAGITQHNLTATSKTLPADRDWAPGTSKLQIVNDLLGAINYRTLYFDEIGYAIARPYVTPSSRASEYTYADDDLSVIFPEVEQGLDLFAIPNKFICVCSESDRAALVSTYTNSNAASPTSTVSRGRTITDYREGIEAADQASLDSIVSRIAFEASQVYEQVTFESGIMPMHSENDCLTLTFTGLDISSKYIETGWSFDLAAGARMKHTIRQVVSI